MSFLGAFVRDGLDVYPLLSSSVCQGFTVLGLVKLSLSGPLGVALTATCQFASALRVGFGFSLFIQWEETIKLSNVCWDLYDSTSPLQHWKGCRTPATSSKWIANSRWKNLQSCARNYGRTYLRMYVWMDGWMKMDEWMYTCRHVWMYVGIYEPVDGLMDGRTDGRTEGWMDGSMDGWTHPCIYSGMQLFRIYIYILYTYMCYNMSANTPVSLLRHV